MVDKNDIWSIETLYAHLVTRLAESDERYEQRFKAQETAVSAAFAAQEKAVAAAFAAQEKAIIKAEIATEKRFESVNEFRAALTDQTSNFVPRLESDIRLTAIESGLKKVEARQLNQVGRTLGANGVWVVAGQLVTLLVAIVAVTISVL